jgi:hypothetical protein
MIVVSNRFSINRSDQRNIPPTKYSSGNFAGVLWSQALVKLPRLVIKAMELHGERQLVLDPFTPMVRQRCMEAPPALLRHREAPLVRHPWVLYLHSDNVSAVGQTRNAYMSPDDNSAAVSQAQASVRWRGGLRQGDRYSEAIHRLIQEMRAAEEEDLLAEDLIDEPMEEVD